MKDVLLSINNLRKNYKVQNGVIEALKGISLDIKEGEIISLLGVNGAGKTTLSSILATLIPATSGDIMYKGSSIYASYNLYKYRSILGFCPQKTNLNSELTLKENLVCAGTFYDLSYQESERRAIDIMQEFELCKYADMSPDVLSGGYKQRFLIARALVNNPRIIILDEPTVALDPHVRRLIWDKILQLKSKGISVILTTHYLDEAEYLSDRVCIMHDGLIKMIDTPQNLIHNFKKGDLEEVFMLLMQNV